MQEIISVRKAQRMFNETYGSDLESNLNNTIPAVMFDGRRMVVQFMPNVIQGQSPSITWWSIARW